VGHLEERGRRAMGAAGRSRGADRLLVAAQLQAREDFGSWVLDPHLARRTPNFIIAASVTAWSAVVRLPCPTSIPP
jgi:hypothetical protein